MLRYDGQLHWEPGGIFKTTCDIDIAYFPFDTQHCPIIVGAYSYYSTRMNITNVKPTVSRFLRCTCFTFTSFIYRSGLKIKAPGAVDFYFVVLTLRC